MKRMLAMILATSILLSLCACGRKTESASEEKVPENASDSVTVKTVGNYIIPDQWTNLSIDDGTYAYITEAAEPEISAVNDHMGHLYHEETDYDAQTIYMTVFDAAGNLHFTLEIPFLQPVEDPTYQGDYLDRCVILEDCVWIAHTFSSYDPETEISVLDGQLEKWSTDGTLLDAMPLSNYGINGEDNFIMDFTSGENNELLLLSQKELLFLDKDGNMIKRHDFAEDIWFQTYRDSSGRCYLFDSLNTNTLYTIDWKNHDLGEALFETSFNTRMLPGGGDYDLLLVNENTLSGANLSQGTITEILHWADYDLAGSISNVQYVDEETFLISCNALTGSYSLYLHRVPADQVPEKTSVYLAVPVPSDPDFEMNWTDCLDQMIIEQMNSFNRRNGDYRIEVITYDSAASLQLLMQSDTPPDLIFWDNGYLAEPASAQIYAAKGYLADLEPLVEADTELSMSDFIPRCVELIREVYGGFYLFPKEFYGRTIVAKSEYVGDEMGWTLEEFCNVVNNLPEDVGVWNGDQKSLLSMLMQTGVGAFVDYTAGTCDFETQTFYDLLTVCRDKCGEEETWSDDIGNDLMRVEPVMGRFGQFAVDTIAPAHARGLTIIGYPGAAGNGFNLTFNSNLSITTVGDHPDVAWSFMQELMGYEFQSNCFGFGSIRQDVYNENEDHYAEIYPDNATPEDYAAAKALPYEAGCTSVYDSPVVAIVMEEAEAFFAGDKTAEETARIIQSRVSIYLGEQS